MQSETMHKWFLSVTHTQLILWASLLLRARQKEQQSALESKVWQNGRYRARYNDVDPECLATTYTAIVPPPTHTILPQTHRGRTGEPAACAPSPSLEPLAEALPSTPPPGSARLTGQPEEVLTCGPINHVPT